MNVHQQLMMTYKSASVAAGLTWNPADSSASYSLENSNLDAFNRSGAAVDHVARSISPKSTGKWYFEFEVLNQGSNAGETIGVGVESTSLTLTHYAGQISKSVGYWNNGARYKNGSSFSASGTYAYAPGDIIGIAFDTATGGMWIRKNGTWIGTDPTGAADSAVASGAPYVVCTTPEDNQWGCRIRNTLTYSLPSGYTQWT